MCNIVLEKHFGRIKAAYKANVFTKGIRPESEDNIKKFESNYVSVPSEYRWLILNMGSCYLAEP